MSAKGSAENGGRKVDMQGTASAIRHIASEPANWLVATSFWGAVTTTQKAWVALASTLVTGIALGGMAVASTSGLLSTPDELNAHIAITDSTFAAHRARIDSLEMASLRRTEGTREMVREVSNEVRGVKVAVDDLTCVLRAQAENRQPEAVCRDPLPLVPQGTFP